MIEVYYAVDAYYANEILAKLSYIGCSEELLEKARKNMLAKKKNMGLTYSNVKKKKSVVVIGLSSSPEEFENTLTHERGHLAAHIGKALGIDPYSENQQYLTGDIARQMCPGAEICLCEHCREENDSPS